LTTNTDYFDELNKIPTQEENVDQNKKNNDEDYETDEEKNTPIKKAIVSFQDVFLLTECSENTNFESNSNQQKMQLSFINNLNMQDEKTEYSKKCKNESNNTSFIHGMPKKQYFAWFNKNEQPKILANKKRQSLSLITEKAQLFATKTIQKKRFSSRDKNKIYLQLTGKELSFILKASSEYKLPIEQVANTYYNAKNLS
jgi:hypothetical protein